MAQLVNSNDFEKEVLQSELPVLVDCYADWCGPCKMMSPVVDSMGEKLSSVLKVVKCNVDESGAVAEKYGISSIPYFMIIKNGKVVSEKIGAKSPADFENWIRENI